MRPSSLLFLGALLTGCASSDPPPPAPDPVESRPYVATERPPPPKPGDGFRDDSEGVVATLVYVTERKLTDGSRQPAALVFTSDPDHKLFHRPPNERVNVKRMFRDQMQILLDDLRERGFDGLPWTAQDYEAVTGPERAFTLFADGKRRFVIKDLLDDAPLKTFSQIERLLINATLAVD